MFVAYQFVEDLMLLPLKGGEIREWRLALARFLLLEVARAVYT